MKRYLSLILITCMIATIFSFSVSAEGINLDNETASQILDNICTMDFVHNGLLVSFDELDYIKQQISEGNEPYLSNFNKIKSTSFASLNYTPTPFEYPTSGFFGTDNQGAIEESNDSRAAYTQALMWYLTDDVRYAENAVNILNAWGRVCKGHKGPNWSLNAAWNGSIFPMAAEIMRNYEGWASADIDQFKEMLSTAFLSILNNRKLYGNRLFSGINALMAIGVFNNDRAAFYQGVLDWLDYVPVYFYIDADNQNPASPNYWKESVKPSVQEYLDMQGAVYPEGKNWLLLDNNPFNNGDDSTSITSGNPGYMSYYGGLPLYNGQLGETGRDFEHAEMGFSAAVNAAEIAYHQGIDLYSVYQERIISAAELHTALRMGKIMPDDFCDGLVTPLSASATYELRIITMQTEKGFLCRGLRNISARIPAGGLQTGLLHLKVLQAQNTASPFHLHVIMKA